MIIKQVAKLEEAKIYLIEGVQNLREKINTLEDQLHEAKKLKEMFHSDLGLVLDDLRTIGTADFKNKFQSACNTREEFNHVIANLGLG